MIFRALARNLIEWWKTTMTGGALPLRARESVSSFLVFSIIYSAAGFGTARAFNRAL
jgi:hypothetical protein